MNLINNLKLFLKYYLKAESHGSPIQEKSMNLVLPEFNIQTFYKNLLSYSNFFKITVNFEVNYKDKLYPIYSLDFCKLKPAKKLLIFSGVHGNEIVSALATIDLLREISKNQELYSDWSIKIITPINPVGLYNISRYNGQGFDINRDFKYFLTKEAALQKDIIQNFKPDIVVSLHEGPQNGFLFITTKLVKNTLKELILNDLRQNNIKLAEKSIIKLPMFTKGNMNEGRFITTIKRILRINTLGTLTNQLGIPLITTESSWSSNNIEERRMAHVVVIKSVINNSYSSTRI